MYSFFIALGLLIAGYFTYGVLVEKIFGIDRTRKTPAYTNQDGVDYIPMPTWRILLIQFLNIAGLGPIFGAIMGITFGPSAFIWIVFGSIFAGAVHDFGSGFLSLRSNGRSLPEIVGEQFGISVKQLMRVFTVFLMVLVGAVFVSQPAVLLNGIAPISVGYWVIIIFGYYMIATLLPIDKIIGKVYPIFGVAILAMAVLMFIYILDNLGAMPEITSMVNPRVDSDANPIFPMLFMTLSCGALSGFHATQSPLMARCLTNERFARPVFYGSMILEGIVALLWAGAAVAFTGSYEGVYENLVANGNSPAVLIKELVLSEYGMLGYILVMLGVVFAPISSGDTALRCGRLIIADMFNIEQKNLVKRLLVSLPLFVIAYFIMSVDFMVVWQYFSWFNQILATMTLWTITIYLARKGNYYFITLIPALFITMAVIAYIFFQPIGLNMGYDISVMIAIGCTAVILGLFFYFVMRVKNGKIKSKF